MQFVYFRFARAGKNRLFHLGQNIFIEQVRRSVQNFFFLDNSFFFAYFLRDLFLKIFQLGNF